MNKKVSMFHSGLSWERQASRLAFEKHGRSTLASDILGYVGLTMEHFFPVLKAVDS